MPDLQSPEAILAMSDADVAELFKKDRATIYRWRKNGLLEGKIDKLQQICGPSFFDSAMEQINERYGEGSIKFGNSDIKTQKVSTGISRLDEIMGGGIPVGKIILLFGKEGSGKTTLALQIMKEFMKKGKVAFVDMEQALDLDYIKNLGIEWNKVSHSQPSEASEALETVRILAESGEYELVVLDSIAALKGAPDIEGQIGDANMCMVARLMSAACRTINPCASENKCTVIFTNQIRMQIMPFPQEVCPGGNAINFYSSVKLKLTSDPMSKSTDTGKKVEIKCVKSRYSSPYKKTNLQLEYGKGFL